jgi:hypothetical protein
LSPRSTPPGGASVGESLDPEKNIDGEPSPPDRRPVMVGARPMFDFLARGKLQAPLFMQKNGPEWLFRATSEPNVSGAATPLSPSTFNAGALIWCGAAGRHLLDSAVAEPARK